MNLPCNTCITLAICKHHKEIECSLLINHYISSLKNYDYEHYIEFIEIINDCNIWWFHITTNYKGEHDNIYTITLKNIFPKLKMLTFFKENID